MNLSVASVIVGLMTGCASGMLGFVPWKWEHWIIFSVGVGSFLVGRYIGLNERSRRNGD